MGQWLRVYSPEGDEGIYRITTTTANYGQAGGTCGVYAEHAVTTLNDTFVPQKLEYKGRTVKQVVTDLLNRQTTKRWKLGVCEVPDSEKLTFELPKRTLLESINEVIDNWHGTYYLSFEFPDTGLWVLNILKVTAEPTCECRLGRNIQSAVVQIDRTDMANKLYCPDWKDSSGNTPATPHSVKDDESIAAWG